MKIQKQQLEFIIKDRRSVYPKDFQEGVKINDAVIEEILSQAMWAPTHKMTQPWYFRVYRNEGVKKFFEKQSEIYQAITPADKIAPRKLEKYQHKAAQVSHVVAVIAKHHPENKIPEIEETVATAAVMQNIYLSMNIFGIAGYLSTGVVCNTPQMSEFLQLGEGDKCLGFFQLGVPVNDLKTYVRKRDDLSTKMEWVD
jgi:nitroreductase